MTKTIMFSQDCLILDACCIINLYASGVMDTILRSITTSIAVAAYVRNKEALTIACESPGNTASQREAIALQPLITSGLLRVVAPETEEELSTLVNFAVHLDDGEAITGAIAFHRNWSIASDDGKALRFFGQHAPHIQLVTTPELIKHWVDTIHPPADVIRAALRNVRIRARYEPHRTHMLYDWWQKCRQNDE